MSNFEIHDVVVVGYGTAGGTAAITAGETLGSDGSVVILEKMSLPGGNSRASAANMTYPNGMEEGRDLFVEYLFQVCNGKTSRELVETFVDGLLENPQWFLDHGGELETNTIGKNSFSLYIPDKTFPELVPELGCHIKHLKEEDRNPEKTGGHRVWAMVDRFIKTMDNVTVELEVSAKEILKNEEGEVIGVLCEKGGEEVTYYAKKGVVLACGGFEFNEEMKKQYLEPNVIHGYGNPGNTGDGITMCQKINAEMVNMTIAAGGINMKVDDFASAFFLSIMHPGYITVDQYGKRWADETHLECHETYRKLAEFDLETFKYMRNPSYCILNKNCIESGPLVFNGMGYNVVQEGYQWSKDNSAEIEKGWIKVAQNIPELASKIGVPLATLRETISNYNNYCHTGQDKEFSRKVDSLDPITAPYYYLDLSCCIFNTQGGAKRDVNAQLIDLNGDPIPRIYSAGEFGSIWGFVYQTSVNYSETIVFGRIAGRNAALNDCVDIKEA